MKANFSKDLFKLSPSLPGQASFFIPTLNNLREQIAKSQAQRAIPVPAAGYCRLGIKDDSLS
jgi:hypothetical protein